MGYYIKCLKLLGIQEAMNVIYYDYHSLLY